MELPKRYDPKEAEPALQAFWKKNGLFAYDPKSKKPLFSIDTPPPYASADHLHVGHAMHYSQFEFVARYKRMRGFNVFFPMGFDDNGLPTERYVEEKHKVDKNSIQRSEFIKLCKEATKVAGKTYHDLFTSLGFSIDWDLLYQTIDDRSQRIAQWSFIDLYNKKRLVRTDLPTMWDVKLQTAIAQADLETKEIESTFNDVVFKSGKEELIIATTRPELIPACVCVCYHPNDKRYQHLKGREVEIPLCDYKVPILPDETVSLDVGTGLMMVCTFGDKEDVEKWHKYNLPLRIIITEDGHLNELAGKYSGLTIKKARKEILADLEKAGFLKAQENIVHPVNVSDRSGAEVEFLKKKQWQVKVLDKKEELIKQGRKIHWYPDHMRIRYEHWVKNLNWDWVISRQRYYGVPFPVWYNKKTGDVVLPEIDELPVDPLTQVPKKWKGKEKDLEPETDVMDTWMTSSVTPQINEHHTLPTQKKHFLPMSMRPQAHDIIRTWAFYTILKSYYHHDDIPWTDIMMSGHGQDPHGQKMSKSKGNFLVAQDVIKKYSADALRFWAANVKLGEDLPYMEKDVVTGQKTATKLWNASKFSIMHLEAYDGNVPEAELELMDKWLLTKFNTMIRSSTKEFDNYEYSKSLAEVENFFWSTFCDYYLEIIKDRLYNSDLRGEEAKTSALYTLYTVLLGQLKMFAPIMPHITDHIYRLFFADKEDHPSIHVSDWPHPFEQFDDKEAAIAGEVIVELLGQVRKYKSEQQMSLRTEIPHAIITLPKGMRKKIEIGLPDFLSAARIADVAFKEGKEPLITMK